MSLTLLGDVRSNYVGGTGADSGTEPSLVAAW